MSDTNINPTDKVSWFSRGKNRTGVVVSIRRKVSDPKRFHGYSFPPRVTMMAKVAEDNNEKVMWEIPFRMLTVIGKAATTEVIKAVDVVSNVSNSIKRHQNERANNRYEIARDRGLLDIKKGQQVGIHYRNGYILPREFVRLTPSFCVEFLENGRVRSAFPQHVDKYVPKTVEA